MFGKLARQLRLLLKRSRSERDMDREVQFHIDMETREHMDEGLSEHEARRRPIRFRKHSVVPGNGP